MRGYRDEMIVSCDVSERESVAAYDLSYTRVIRETPDAYLLLFYEGETVFDESKSEWLPKSEVVLNEGDKMVTVPEWLAIEKGLV
jgi:hypothetical protein